MTFNEYFQENKLKNRATSTTKIQQVLVSIGFCDAGIHSRDRAFSSDIGIVILHLSKGTHWVIKINENYFDSYGCAPPKKLSKIVIKRYGHCL